MTFVKSFFRAAVQKKKKMKSKRLHLVNSLGLFHVILFIQALPEHDKCFDDRAYFKVSLFAEVYFSSAKAFTVFAFADFD